MGIRGPKPYGIGCVTSHADLGFYEPQAEGRCPFRARLRNGHGRRTLSQQRRELHRPGESMSGPASIHFPVGPECQNPPPIRVHLCSSVVPMPFALITTQTAVWTGLSESPSSPKQSRHIDIANPRPVRSRICSPNRASKPGPPSPFVP